MKVPAGELMARADIDIDAVARDIPGVDPWRVMVRPAPRWFRVFWARWVGAMALPWGVYLRPERFDLAPAVLGELIVHEVVHIAQWRRLGPWGWAKAYVGGYRSGRRLGLARHDAYLEIPLEVEARAIAKQHAPS